MDPCFQYLYRHNILFTQSFARQNYCNLVLFSTGNFPFDRYLQNSERREKVINELCACVCQVSAHSHTHLHMHPDAAMMLGQHGGIPGYPGNWKRNLRSTFKLITLASSLFLLNGQILHVLKFDYIVLCVF